MTNLTVDYDVWIDPANVGDHQMWGFARKSGTCDVDTGAQGVIFASNTQRFRIGVGTANLQQTRVRLPEGAWKHVTYTQSLNANGTNWTGNLYLDGVQHAQVTNLTTPHLGQRRGHQLQLPRPLADVGQLLVPRHAQGLPGLRPGGEPGRGSRSWPTQPSPRACTTTPRRSTSA